MGKVRVRKETGKLQLDFHYNAARFREQTDLLNTPSNRKRVEKLLAVIESKILVGQFDYSEMFPNSRNIIKFQRLQHANVAERSVSAEILAPLI